MHDALHDRNETLQASGNHRGSRLYELENKIE